MRGHQIIFAMDVVVVFGALLLAAGNVVRLPRNRNALLVAAILVCNVCAVVLARYQYGYWIPEPYRIDVAAWEPLLNIGRNLTPGLFMLLCHSLFQDRQRFPRWLLGLFAFQVLLEEPAHLLIGPEAPGQQLVTEVLPGLLEALFAGFAVYWTVTGWNADLVQTRRRLRWIVLGVFGVLILGSVLLLRVVIPMNSVYNYYANVALSALDAAVLAAILLAMLSKESMERFLDPAHVPAPQPPGDDPERVAAAAAVAELRRLMEEERVYRQAGLTVAGLAKQIRMPEYRLRRLIHEELGYRNFNLFLHEHRIREACALLDDPEQRRLPILTIALSVGYQSINTFNRGFREIVGTTPSAYRAGTTAEDGTAPEQAGVEPGQMLPRS